MKQRRSKRTLIGKRNDVVVALRKTIKLGDSLCITLPREWVEKHGIKEGEELPIICNTVLKIVPIKEI